MHHQCKAFRAVGRIRPAQRRGDILPMAAQATEGKSLRHWLVRFDGRAREFKTPRLTKGCKTESGYDQAGCARRHRRAWAHRQFASGGRLPALGASNYRPSRFRYSEFIFGVANDRRWYDNVKSKAAGRRSPKQGLSRRTHQRGFP
jgi:hypothetical protein